MKLYIAIAVLAACVFAEEWNVKSEQEIQNIHGACKDEHHLSAEQNSRMYNFDLPNEEIVRKYLQCFSERVGIFSPEQGFHVDRFVKQNKAGLEKDILDKKSVEDCIAENPWVVKADDVHVYKVFVCLMKKHPKAAQE